MDQIPIPMDSNWVQEVESAAFPVKTQCFELHVAMFLVKTHVFDIPKLNLPVEIQVFDLHDAGFLVKTQVFALLDIKTLVFSYEKMLWGTQNV
mgnify:CR=1 FL=1